MHVRSVKAEKAGKVNLNLGVCRLSVGWPRPIDRSIINRYGSDKASPMATNWESYRKKHVERYVMVYYTTIAHRQEPES